MMLGFASPYFLLLLLSIPLFIFYGQRRRRYPAMGVSGLVGTTGLGTSFAMKIKWVVPVAKLTGLGLLIMAMARPQWGTQQMEIKTEGINIVLAMDLSESMAALDFKKQGNVVNRLEAAKAVVSEFITKRDGDRIAMVVFGSQAYTQIPLTRDYNTIVSILDRLEIGAAGKTTAIGDAIGIAVKRIKDIPSKSNIIILLTDGRSNSGELSPDIAADIAAEKKIKIYTIGIGGKDKAPFLIKDPFWGERYVYQQVDMDEGALKMIAEKTGGLFFRAGDTEKLREIYHSIDKLEKSEVKVKTYAEYRDLYPYPLLAGFLLLSLWAVLTHTRFLRIP
jgi:Ca-activated chloride channel homolog